MENITGHPCISLGKLNHYYWLNKDNNAWILRMNGNRKDKLLKLHLQFAYCSAEKPVKILKYAYEKIINSIKE